MTVSSRLLLAALFATLAAAPASAEPVTGATFPALAIKDARIVTQAGKEIPKGTILIRNGTIVAVGESLTIPPDADIFDATGLTAYPGFIDGSSALGNPKEIEKERKSGSGADVKYEITRGAFSSTRKVDRRGIFPDYSVAENLKLDSEEAAAWRRAGFAAVHSAPGDAILAGQSALIFLLDETDAPRREAVASPRAAMIGGWRVPGFGYPRSLMGGVAHLRQTLLDAQYYGKAWALYQDQTDEAHRPDFDAAMDALQPLLRREQMLVLPAASREEIYRALRFSREFELRAALAGGQEAYRALDRLKESKAPVLLEINFPEKPENGATSMERLRSVAERYGLELPKASEEAAKAADKQKRVSEPDRAYNDRLRLWNERVATAKALSEAGIPFAICSRGNKDAKKFQENLLKAIEAGLTPDVALTALTLAPARILGLEKSFGSLEPGKAGNVTLIKGDFGKKDSSIAAVVVHGRKYEMKPAKDEKKDESTEKKKEAETKAEPATGDAAKKKPFEASWAVETDDDRVPKTHTGGSVHIKNATVLTMTGQTLSNTSILVEKGIIKKIGSDLSEPRGLTVIDGAGAWVIPGIIDCHSHMAIAGGVNEATDSITAQVRIGDVLDGSDITIYRAAAGGVTAANILHGSANTIGGQRAVIQMRYDRPAEELLFDGFPQGIKFALGENVTRTKTRFPVTRMGVEAVIRRALGEARQYQASLDAYESLPRREKKKTLPPRRDLRLEALAGILKGDILVHCHSYNADEIAMVLGVFEEFGIHTLTFEHGLEAFKVAPEIAKFGASVSSFADNWAYKIEAYDAIPYNVPLLHEAGVNALLNSDSGERGRRMPQEAGKMVRFGGMSYEEALRTITLNPAIALKIDKKVGSIEVGKQADLALYNGHPLNGYARCFITLVAGEVVFERTGERGGPFPLESAKAVDLGAIALNPQGRYAVVNARIHPVSAPEIEKGKIVFENGRIVAVGADAAVPSDATVIDAQGLDLYPGFIDGGSPLGLNEIEALAVTVDSAEGGDLQPDLKAAIAVKPDSEIIPVARFTGLTSAVSNPVGGLISGQSALIQLDGWTPKEMAYIPTLALEIALPSNGSVNVAALFSETETKKGPTAEEKIARLKDLFAKGKRYEQGKSEAIARGEKFPLYEPDLEALIPYIRREKPVVFDASAPAEILDAIDLAKELGIRAVLRGGDEAWKVAAQIAEAEIPVVVGPVTALPADSYDPYDAAFANASKLNAAGIKIGFQSTNASDARNLPFNAALAVAYGLPRDAAIRALTLGNAEIYGVDQEVGSLDPAKRADLILVEGDPLQPTATVRAMFINGRPVNLDDNKHTRLYKKYRERLKTASAASN